MDGGEIRWEGPDNSTLWAVGFVSAAAFGGDLIDKHRSEKNIAFEIIDMSFRISTATFCQYFFDHAHLNSQIFWHGNLSHEAVLMQVAFVLRSATARAS
jgi:hypothetical protein